MNEHAIVLNYFTLGKTNMLCVTKSTSLITHCINLDQLKKNAICESVNCQESNGCKRY